MPHLYPPTPGENRWRATGYFFVSAVGFWVLFGPPAPTPESRSYIVGIASVIWALFMVTALPTAVSVLMGRYRLEAVLLPVFSSALGVAIINVFIRVLSGEVDLAARGFIAAACFSFLVVRGLQLHRITKAEAWTSMSRKS